MLGLLYRHQTGRGHLARLWKCSNRAAFISESTHSTGLLSSGLAIGNKDTVSRHVHRELNPQAVVPAQELPAAWRAVPPTRSLAVPQATSAARLRHLSLLTENQKQTLSSKTNLFPRTSHMFSDKQVGWSKLSTAHLFRPATAGSHLWVHMGRWSMASRHGASRLFGQAETSMSYCQCSACSRSERLCEELGGVIMYYYITEH